MQNYNQNIDSSAIRQELFAESFFFRSFRFLSSFSLILIFALFCTLKLNSHYNGHCWNNVKDIARISERTKLHLPIRGKILADWESKYRFKIRKWYFT